MSLRAVFAIPGDLASLTGGYAYDREVLARLAGLQYLPLGQGFPFPSAQTLAQSAQSLAQVGADHVLLCDGLAFGALPEAIVASISAPVVALVHHPLALETGLGAQAAKDLAAREKAALSHARAVIVTSQTTSDVLVADYGVLREIITIALPGTQRAPRAGGSGGPSLQLLAVGSVVPRKGYDVLLDALDLCAGLDWQLTIAGSLARAPAYAQSLLARASGRVHFAGEVASQDLDRLYDHADLFVMSSHYEGYGMVLGEAMVRGLPIVTTDGGALAQTVPDNAALKVPAGDVKALGAALRHMIGDAQLRRLLAQASFEAGEKLPTWDATARMIAHVLEKAQR